MEEFNDKKLVEFLKKAAKVPLGTKLKSEDCQYAKNFSKKFLFDGLTVNASVGMTGNAAYIPFIGFTHESQSIVNGIYPCFLFYKRHNLLILSYCESKQQPPSVHWNVDSQSIGDFLKDHLNNRDLKLKSNSETKYNESKVFKFYDLDSSENGELDLSRFDARQAIEDLRTIVNSYKKIFEGKEQTDPQDPQDNEASDRPVPGYDASIPANGYFDMGELCRAVAASKLIYSPNLIRRFVCALMTKPFVILSGLAGSGKTQLARAFAYAICEDIKKQFLLVPVGADWTNRDPLLGYPNALNEKDYRKDDYGVVDLILRAEEDPHKPYFLVLDEMNMSYVERYFSDFLSAMESGESISLWNNPDPSDKTNPPSEIKKLPKNLFIIGTINVDETTYMFSPKVLDRASVVEFKVGVEDMEKFLSRSEDDAKSSAELCSGLAAHMAGAFIKESTENNVSKNEAVNKILMDFFRHLKKLNAEFGYRSAVEIYKYIGNFVKYAIPGDEADGSILDKAVDSAIVQKILPKLHGSQRRLKPVLQSLWNICYETEPSALEDLTDDRDLPSTRYPLAADKIRRMHKIVADNGFASFAEA